MPREYTKNPEKYVDNDVNKVYKSKKEADARYEKSIYKLSMRLPQKDKQIIESYIADHDQNCDPDEKYNSINGFVKSLIYEKIGIDK